VNKILIKLYVPMLEEEYEVWIPPNKKIHTVIGLLVKAVNEFSGGQYTPNKLPELYNKATGKCYDINLTVSESDIKNSSDIILL